jgi:malate dehydrogenase (oxaloacetate-decarboxylating)(NADP+)
VGIEPHVGRRPLHGRDRPGLRAQGALPGRARALAELAREDVAEEVERAYGRERFSFGPEYLLPKPIDPRILVRESAAVAERAIEEGVARRPLDSRAYQESLTVRLGTGRETLRGMILTARQHKLRVVFSEGTSETVLRACSILIEEGIASPILLGRESEVKEAIERLRSELSGVPVIDPLRSPRFESYVDAYVGMRRRRGVMRAAAAQRLRQTDSFAAMMLHSGDADMMIAGVSLLQHVGGAVPIGPLLMGTRLPAHLLQYGATVEEVVNLATVGAVEAAALKQAD